MTLWLTCLAVWASLANVVANPSPKQALAELDQKRIEVIAAWLPQNPCGFSKPITDRLFWESESVKLRTSAFTKEAKKLLPKPFPAWDDALYLDFSRSGQRPPGEKMLRSRNGWLTPLVLAECLENQGRYLPRIHEILREYVTQPTWTLPAHDHSLANFKRKAYSVDLAAADMAAQLAEAVYLLDAKIDTSVRVSVIDALETRIFAPVRNSLRTGNGHWWLGSMSHPVQNNWNPVCLAGVIGAACRLLPDRAERALFVAAGEHYSTYFINGFRADGYCDEGYGYWVYGFSNYAMLREILYTASAGNIDLFTRPKVQEIALYGARAMMGDALVPNFADSRSGTRANYPWIGYCNRVLGLGLDDFSYIDPPSGNSLQGMFMPATPVKKPASSANLAIGTHSYFADAGVLICRPEPQDPKNFSMAVKAGGNSSHSHNDIGSFVIALEGELIVGDPGGPYAYNNKTFGPNRYDCKLLNSFGHPVPVIDGALQIDASKLQPKVLATNFTANAEEIQIDLHSAYTVPKLNQLVRTIRFERGANPKIVLEDQIKSATPVSFEMALPTLGTWKSLDANRLEFRIGKARLHAHIETPDGYTITDEVISELNAPPFHRVGIKLRKPISAASIRITFVPISESNSDKSL